MSATFKKLAISPIEDKNERTLVNVLVWRNDMYRFIVNGATRSNIGPNKHGWRQLKRIL